MTNQLANLPVLRRLLFVVLALHPLAYILSCASVPELPWAGVPKDASAGFYDTARLEYRLDAGKLGQPLDVVRVDGRQVAFEQIASSPLPDRSIGTLVMQHPHPAGKADVVRVTFSIDSAGSDAAASSAWNLLKSGDTSAMQIGKHEEVHEVWAMDLPKADWDRCFAQLNSQNFFHADAAEKAPAQLAVTINGKEVRKNWELVPELNGLAQRVRREGQLVAYLRPQALAGESTKAIASVQAYRDLVAKTGGPTGPSTQPASGILTTQPSMTAGKNAPYAVR
jgi:hypothetical protein